MYSPTDPVYTGCDISVKRGRPEPTEIQNVTMRMGYVGLRG
jgi:hypothetical protein